MTAANHVRVLDRAVGTLESDSAKQTLTDSATPTTSHTLTHSPAANRLTEVFQVSTDRATDRIGSTNILGHYTTQREGESESSDTQYFDTSQPASATACTSDTFGNEVGTISPTFKGALGKDVTIRYKLSVSNTVNATAMCARNVVMTGRDVRFVDKKRRGAKVGPQV